MFRRNGSTEFIREDEDECGEGKKKRSRDSREMETGREGEKGKEVER